jgi:hypothetical protein
MAAKKIHRAKVRYGTGIPRPSDITDLMPWEEVARRWNEMSGESISDSRCQQLAGRAEKKIHAAMVGYVRELWYEKK